MKFTLQRVNQPHIHNWKYKTVRGGVVCAWPARGLSFHCSIQQGPEIVWSQTWRIIRL